MKKKTIALLLVLMMIFGVTCGGTIAYLTSTASVTNTFTIGNVKITLDETKVDVYGEAVTGEGAGRFPAGNEYKLMPGHTYTKDPIIHVDASSENCYVFVKIENGISTFESAKIPGEEKAYNTIHDQILANDWKALDGNTGVYYMEYTKDQADKDLEVFAEFRIADDANTKTGWDKINSKDTTVVVTGYAIQSADLADADSNGTVDAADAWALASAS